MKQAKIALIALALLAASSIARAQKPALTQNIDEKGRTPYQAGKFATCQDGLCQFLFPPIPTGFRLVLTNISGTYTTDQPNNTPTLNGNQSSPVQSGDQPIIILQREVLISGTRVSTYTVINTVLAYFDAGQTPIIFYTATTGPSGHFTLSGYLVANP